MTRLSIMDQIFYKTEMGGLPTMYMSGAMIVDPSTSPYPLDAQALAGHLAARMERIPLLRQKLIQDALKLGSLRLVDDPQFDVNNHVTCMTLPAPGGYRELTGYLGELSQRRLDLSKPLWRFEVIDGLEGGNIGIAMQLHHSILDGTGATRTLDSIWSSNPEPAEKPRAGAWEVTPSPSSLRLLLDALLEGGRRSYILRPKTAMTLLQPLLQSLLKRTSTAGVEAEEAAALPKPEVHKTSLNTDTSSGKHSLSYAGFSLQDIKALSRHFGGTVNDTVLLLCSFALQHYFDAIDETIDFDLVALMPMQMRSKDDPTSGNVVTARFINLRNTIPAVDKRLLAIIADTRAIKEKFRSGGDERKGNKRKGNKLQLEPGDILELFDPVMLDIATQVIKRAGLLGRLMISNTVITNVPGSAAPVYLAGARQVGVVPMAPVVPFLGLTIGVTSSESKLFIGFHGCDIEPDDKDYFVDGAQEAFTRLNAIAKRDAKAGKNAGTRPGPGKAGAGRSVSPSTVKKAETGSSATKKGKSAVKKAGRRKAALSKAKSPAKKTRASSASNKTRSKAGKRK